jgi:hypothetical protein
MFVKFYNKLNFSFNSPIKSDLKIDGAFRLFPVKRITEFVLKRQPTPFLKIIPLIRFI